MALSIIDGLSLAVLLLAAVGVILYVKARAGVHGRVNQRLHSAVRGSAADNAAVTPAGFVNNLGYAFHALGKAVPLFNAPQRSEMSQKLIAAGYRQLGALLILMGLSVGSGLFAMLLLVVLVWPMLDAAGAAMRIASLLGAGYLGLLLPRIVLDRMVRRRQQAIERHFPDALDLMVVCANAGLGLNAAMQRVAQELEFLAPQLADELKLTSDQLQLSGDMATAMNALAKRIGLASMRSLASTLIQSRQFGTPIVDALRILSQGERTARLMRTEEAAAKLATKITVPMMIFILPTVLLVAGGPAFLALMSSFGN